MLPLDPSLCWQHNACKIHLLEVGWFMQRDVMVIWKLLNTEQSLFLPPKPATPVFLAHYMPKLLIDVLTSVMGNFNSCIK